MHQSIMSEWLGKQIQYALQTLDETINNVCNSFVDLSPTASFQSYDHELVSSSTTSGSKGQGDEVHGKTENKYINNFKIYETIYKYK